MRAASRLSLLLTVAFIPGLFGCTRSSTTRSSCFNEYVSLEQVQSYSDALDLTVKNVFTKEDSLPRCQSLVDAVVGEGSRTERFAGGCEGSRGVEQLRLMRLHAYKVCWSGG